MDGVRSLLEDVLEDLSQLKHKKTWMTQILDSSVMNQIMMEICGKQKSPKDSALSADVQQRQQQPQQEAQSDT